MSVSISMTMSMSLSFSFSHIHVWSWGHEKKGYVMGVKLHRKWHSGDIDLRRTNAFFFLNSVRDAENKQVNARNGKFDVSVHFASSKSKFISKLFQLLKDETTQLPLENWKTRKTACLPRSCKIIRLFSFLLDPTLNISKDIIFSLNKLHQWKL